MKSCLPLLPFINNGSEELSGCFYKFLSANKYCFKKLIYKHLWDLYPHSRGPPAQRLLLQIQIRPGLFEKMMAV